MEREFGEFGSETEPFASEIERLGISEMEEDKAVENPTISVKQQQKRSKNASKHMNQPAPLFQNKSNKPQKSQKTVFNSPTKKKEIILLRKPSSE